MNPCQTCDLEHHSVFDTCTNVVARAGKLLKDGPPTYGLVCPVCVKIHTTAITCGSIRADYDNAERLRAREIRVVTTWRETIADAWRAACSMARLEKTLRRMREVDETLKTEGTPK
jgi:hypothetical protein